MRWVLFGISLGAHLALLGATVVAVLRPELRLWPPPGRRSWQFRLTWVLFLLASGAGLGLGIADWNGLALTPWIRFPLGIPLIGGGLTLAAWGIHTLSARQTLGLAGELTTVGPYRITRNPQYVGDIAATLGWMILAGSALVILTGVPAILWYLLLPRAEEPWLQEQFGAPYSAYRESVPRFLLLVVPVTGRRPQ